MQVSVTNEHAATQCVRNGTGMRVNVATCIGIQSDQDKANAMYERLLMIWSDDALPSVREAKQFVAVN